AHRLVDRVEPGLQPHEVRGAVPPGPERAVYRVSEPAPFTHFPAEAGRGAAAENIVRDHEGKVVRVVLADARARQRYGGLGQGPADHARLNGGRGGGGGDG